MINRIKPHAASFTTRNVRIGHCLRVRPLIFLWKLPIYKIHKVYENCEIKWSVFGLYNHDVSTMWHCCCHWYVLLPVSQGLICQILIIQSSAKLHLNPKECHEITKSLQRYQPKNVHAFYAWNVREINFSECNLERVIEYMNKILFSSLGIWWKKLINNYLL